MTSCELHDSIMDSDSDMVISQATACMEPDDGSELLPTEPRMSDLAEPGLLAPTLEPNNDSNPTMLLPSESPESFSKSVISAGGDDTTLFHLTLDDFSNIPNINKALISFDQLRITEGIGQGMYNSNCMYRGGGAHGV